MPLVFNTQKGKRRSINMEARGENTEYLGAELQEENKKAKAGLPEMDFTVGSIPAHLIKFSIPLTWPPGT